MKQSAALLDSGFWLGYYFWEVQSAAASAAIVVTAATATVVVRAVTTVTAAAEQEDKDDNPAAVTAKVETRHNNVLLVRILKPAAPRWGFAFLGTYYAEYQNRLQFSKTKNSVPEGQSETEFRAVLKSLTAKFMEDSFFFLILFYHIHFGKSIYMTKL